LFIKYILNILKETYKKIIEIEENNENETHWNCFEMAPKGL